MDNLEKTIILFDVDGTLTKPRQVISQSTFDFLQLVRKKVKVGLVGGSDLDKIAEQMGGKQKLEDFDYVFSENGVIAHKNGNSLGEMSIVDQMGEESLQDLINFSLHYMSTLTLPRKRGTFIEFRKGMINISPIGRSCSQSERDEFFVFDQEHGIREKFVQALKGRFNRLGLTFSIGGQISIDVFPHGWDKRFCLRYLKEFDTIHFFGDKTSQGGNDYEIFEDPSTIGHTVTSPEDTERQLRDLLHI